MENLIKTVFHRYDSGHKGYLTREDVKVAVVALFGYKPTKYELDQIIDTGDLNQQGLSLPEFVDKMTPRFAAIDEDEEIRQIFLVLDSQCRGFLTVEDLKKAFSIIAPHLPAHTIEATFREVDRDGDGRVSYKDFEFMMKYSLTDGF